MKLVSISLYGEDPKYNQGSIENAILIKEALPDWRLRVYVDYLTSKTIIRRLEHFDAEVVVRSKDWHSNGMFWRYLPIGETGLSRIIFRDADSRILERDIWAIREWELADSDLHVIRDHPFHNIQILGGLWGVRNEALDPELFWLKAQNFDRGFGQDQFFLAKHVYPLLKDSITSHDAFFQFEKKHNHISCPRIKGSYMGESFDQHNNFDQELRDTLLRVESSLIRLALLRTKSKFLQ
ncbi:hypothetical protein MCEJIRE27_00032 [Candidatus Nanopelagicaceae bacterium]